MYLINLDAEKKHLDLVAFVFGKHEPSTVSQTK